MTASGFQKLADNLKQAMPVKGYYPEAYRQWERDIMAICNALAQDNPAFNRGLFLAECGAFS